MEMTVKQITSKIFSTEKKIDEVKKMIETYETWLSKAETSEKSRVSFYKKSLRERNKKLNKYEAQLAEFKGMIEGKIKEYPIIREFVNTWKAFCIANITSEETINGCVNAYFEMKSKQKEIEEEYKAKGLPSYHSYNKRHDIEKSFLRKWDFVYTYLKVSTKTIDMEKLENDYTYEATRKYNKFIEDCEFYVGEITDTKNLSVGKKGDLNGFVVGTKGKCEVETISACGEIRRFHYRTLFKMVK